MSAVDLSVSWQDVNGVKAKNTPHILDTAGPAAVCQALANLSNAAIIGAKISTPVTISGLTSNTATNTNVESAKFKMRLSYSGPIPAGGAERAKCSVEVPAPLGTVINGLSGDLTNSDALALIPLLCDTWGNPMDTLDKIEYVRS